MLFSFKAYQLIIASMAVIGLIVFVILHFVEAGYGILLNNRWGKTVSSKVGWFLMEMPLFLTLSALFITYGLDAQGGNILIFSFILFHYMHRAFIFPFLIVGKGRMPILIILMGITFNLINGTLQGEWLFGHAPVGYYGGVWELIVTPKFIIGTALFIGGMWLNIDSDKRLRDTRKAGIKRGDKPGTHYIPQGGGFRYVTSPNYLGEIVEWVGFAVISWSLPGVLFAFWTIANLAPRAASTWKRHKVINGPEVERRALKRLIPFIY